MPALETIGAYCSVENLKRATNYTSAGRDQVILDYVNAASRDIEHDTLRRFFPIVAMVPSRWPVLSPQATWEVWTEQDLLTVTLLQAAAGGQNATPVTLTHYYLEPQEFGPPYNRVEVDLSTGDVFTSGNTWQRAVQITGQWGYTNNTRSVTTLGSAITTTTATTLTPTTVTAVEQGDVLLIDSEAIYVDYTASPITAFNVIRGVNGTTAATHLVNAPIVKYVAPDDVRNAVRQRATAMLEEGLDDWGRVIGQGDQAIQYKGRSGAGANQKQNYWEQVVQNRRRYQFAAV